jgi:hypothetical protein
VSSMAHISDIINLWSLSWWIDRNGNVLESPQGQTSDKCSVNGY